jgi:HTH-type transcriptional regulator/antitoxin MqsA
MQDMAALGINVAGVCRAICDWIDAGEPVMVTITTEDPKHIAEPAYEMYPVMAGSEDVRQGQCGQPREPSRTASHHLGSRERRRPKRMTDTRCAVCGEGELAEQRGTYVFEWPADFPVESSRFDEATWWVCGSCEEEELPPELVARIEAERYRLEGLLSPLEVQDVRKRVGLSQREMAKLLGVGEKTYTRWELGLSAQTKSMDNLIRLADQHPEILLEIESRRNPQRQRVIREYFDSLPEAKAGSALALAAHGGELDQKAAQDLRARLLKLAEER